MFNYIKDDLVLIKQEKNLFLKENALTFIETSHLIKNRDAVDGDRRYFLIFLIEYFKQINNVHEITSKVFWNISNEILKNKKIINKGKTIKLLIDFFCFLYNKYKYDFFADSDQITILHLFDDRFKTFIVKKYSFIKFNGSFQKQINKKICIYIKGLNKYSTRCAEEEIISVDLSKLKTVYADLLLEYIFTNVNNVLWNITRSVGYIKNELIKIQTIKAKNNYPNPDLLKFTCEEAILLKESIYSLEKSDSTKNNHLGWIRRFFIWMHDSNKAYFEKLFFIYIRGEDPQKNFEPKAIPTEHLKLINNKMHNNAQNEILDFMFYIVFQLLLQTQFRLGQILHLKLNCLRQTFKSGEYLIIQNTKTTNGRLKEFVVASKTKELIDEVIKRSEPLRQKAQINAYKNYIFLFEKINSGIAIIRAGMFTEYLKKVCKQLDLPSYNAANLRHTHMTYSELFANNNKMSDLELTVLTGHKKIDTTLTHYIDPMIEEMIESTLGFTLEQNHLDVSDKVISKEAGQKLSKEHIVENGCGKCTLNKCTEQFPLSCYICKHFVTTIEHEHFFEKQIKILQEQKKEGMNRHDIESINVIISILAAYLIKIKTLKAKNE